MNDYIFRIGDDYECNNKEYVALTTDKGQQITVTLTASGVPFKGRFDKSISLICNGTSKFGRSCLLGLIFALMSVIPL